MCEVRNGRSAIVAAISHEWDFPTIADDAKRIPYEFGRWRREFINM
jgi:hypothetical protein